VWLRSGPNIPSSQLRETLTPPPVMSVLVSPQTSHQCDPSLNGPTCAPPVFGLLPNRPSSSLFFPHVPQTPGGCWVLSSRKSKVFFRVALVFLRLIVSCCCVTGLYPNACPLLLTHFSAVVFLIFFFTP